ncbi:MAG: SpoIIE family protein phosphatase [Magnetococcales bacterium]|nr:SpoIIE family protein phosphatase [Magnetococcales bacterium]
MSDLESSFSYNRNICRRINKGPCTFPILRDNAEEIIAEERSGYDRRILSLSAHLDLFNNLHDEETFKSLANCPVKNFDERTILLEKGKVNNNLYFVLSGSMTVHLDSPDSDFDFRVNSGECVGEMSVIDKSPISAHVVAEKGCRILVITEDYFWNKIMSKPMAVRNLLKIQTERARKSNIAIVNQMKREVHLQLIERDLAVASNIQTSMLPHNFALFSEPGNWEFYGRMLPARDIGGDLFDIFELEPGRLFFLLGDVSGKGVPAALFMVRTMTLFRSIATADQRPAEILEKVNKELKKNNKSMMFVTIFCGIFDTKTGLIQFSNAGHNSPLIRYKNGHCAELELPQGLIAGIIEDATFINAEHQLEKGDTLLVFTDGVTEAMNEKEELFSDKRLFNWFEKENMQSGKMLLDRLYKAVKDFSGSAPQADDITVLTLKRESTP